MVHQLAGLGAWALHVERGIAKDCCLSCLHIPPSHLPQPMPGPQKAQRFAWRFFKATESPNLLSKHTWPVDEAYEPLQPLWIYRLLRTNDIERKSMNSYVTFSALAHH